MLVKQIQKLINVYKQIKKNTGLQEHKFDIPYKWINLHVNKVYSHSITFISLSFTDFVNLSTILALTLLVAVFIVSQRLSLLQYTV